MDQLPTLIESVGLETGIGGQITDALTQLDELTAKIIQAQSSGLAGGASTAVTAARCTTIDATRRGRMG